MKFLNAKTLLPVFIIMVSLVVSLNIFLKRLNVDYERRNAQFSVTEKSLFELKKLSGKDLQSMLAVLKDQIGISSIIVPEYTIADYEKLSKLTVLSGHQIINTLRVGQLYRTVISRLSRRSPIVYDATYIIVDEVKLYNRVISYLKLSLPIDSVIEHSGRIIQVNTNADTIRAIPLGFNEDVLSHYISYGFNIIPQLNPMKNISDSKIKLKFSELDGIEKIDSILFSQDFNFGDDQYITQFIDTMKRSNYYLIFPEFDQSSGLIDIALAMPTKTIRSHLIPKDKVFDNFDVLFSRYRRALNERSIHLLELKPVNAFEFDNMYEKNLVFMKKVIDTYKRTGGQTTDYFQTYKKISLNYYEKIIISLGIFSALFIALIKVHQLNNKQVIILSGILLVVMASVLMFKSISISVLGVMAAVLGPVFAMIFFYPNSDQYYYSKISNYLNVISAIGLMIMTCFCSVLYCVALYSDPVFIQHILPFKGVKIALIFPVILIGLYYYCGAKQVNSIYYVFRRLFKSNLTVKSSTTVIFIIIIFSFYLLRSGNFLYVSKFEYSIRFYLENLFIVRPRFKEILTGYPALFLGIWFMNTKINKHRLWLFNTIGCIGLSSIINSFCHFHTPLIISIYRTIIGIILGAFVSIIIYYIVLMTKKLFRSLSIISQ